MTGLTKKLKQDCAGDARLEMLEAIRSVIGNSPATAVVHSDLSTFRFRGTEILWDVLYAFKVLVEEGWVFYFPSFTFSFCSGVAYDVKSSPSETGILADAVLENFSSAERTMSPIYSFVRFGNQVSQEYFEVQDTTFGEGSIFSLFEKENAKIVMLGCGWEYCTLFHRYEELENVSYRQYKTFEGAADFGNGSKQTKCRMFVRDLSLDAINDFEPAISALNHQQLINKFSLEEGTIQSVEAVHIRDICLQQLKDDPLVYVSNKNIVAKKLRDSREIEQQENINVAIFSHKNTQIFERHLREKIHQYLPERGCALFDVPYGQMYNYILDESSELWDFKPNNRIFLDRLCDVRGVDLEDFSKTIESVQEYAQLILSFHEKCNGWTFVHLFFQDNRASVASKGIEYNELVSRCNMLLKEILGSASQLVLLDLSSEIAAYDGAVFDPRLEYVGRFPFSDGFSSHVALYWCSLVIATIGKNTRLMVIDLDNTLWGGVLGEDGASNLLIGGDFPGNAFLDFQKAILEYQKRGVAIAIASKNDKDLALSAIASIPDMVIQEHHLQAHAINWKPKWQNIQEICSELNLGLGSVLFIDDNPVEREAVKRNLPDVKVLPLSDDVSEYKTILHSSPYLRAVNVTKEDLGRLKDFSARKERRAFQSKSASLEDYHKSLNICLVLSDLNSNNIARASQLCQKTNQFNTTTRRYDDKALLDLKSKGAKIFVVNYSDRFSPAENIGLLVVKFTSDEKAVIDLYLLSCRVLGRGIEASLPNIIAEYLYRQNIDMVFGEVIETERNTPARNVFQEAKFKQSFRANFWEFETKNFDVPTWIDYEIKIQDTL